MKKRWLLLFSVAWPMIHLVVFLFRFRSLPPLLELAWFVPTGVLGTLALHLLVSRSGSAGQTMSTVAGTALLVPLAVAGNLVGGLLGPLAVTVYGLAPLTAGAVCGWWFGRRFNHRRRR